MGADKTSNWTKEAVLRQLESADSATPGLQAFLGPDVPSTEVDSVAHAIVAAASGGEEPQMGPVSKLGKSFSVRGNLAVLRRIAEDPRVANITPTEINDIMVNPRKEK